MMPSCERRNSCQICGELPDGVHYGVLSCRSCKVFFRRTIRFEMEYVCERGGECNIRGANRAGCRYCRYQTCVRKGMKQFVPKRKRSTNSDAASCSSWESVDTPPPLSIAILSPEMDEDLNGKFGEVNLGDAVSDAAEVLGQISKMPLPQLLEYGAQNYNAIVDYFRSLHQEMKPAVIRRLCSSSSDKLDEGIVLAGQPHNALFKTADESILFRQLSAYLERAVNALKACPLFNSLSLEDRISLLRRHAVASVVTTLIMTTLPTAGSFLVLLDALHVLERNSSDNPLMNDMVGHMIDNVIPQIRELCMDENELTMLRTIMAWAPEGFLDQSGKQKGHRIQQLLLLCLKNYTNDRIKRVDLGGIGGTSGLRYAKLLAQLGLLEEAARRLRACIHAVSAMSSENDPDPLIQELFSESTTSLEDQPMTPESGVETDASSADGEEAVPQICPAKACFDIC